MGTNLKIAGGFSHVKVKEIAELGDLGSVKDVHWWHKPDVVSPGDGHVPPLPFSWLRKVTNWPP